jgi:DNA-directed RNA polymerase subunit RPC12/RpoP
MPYLLPKKYKKAHQIAFYFHDAILSTMNDLENNHIFLTEINVQNDEIKAEFEKTPKAEILQFLDEKGFEKYTHDIVIKSVFRSLVYDMLHFIFESLDCSSKSKLTVAYALLRKPFKENLFYLELILHDYKDFYLKFKSDNPNELNISDNKSFPDTKKIEIIENALSLSEFGKIFQSDFIYDLRYNKNCEYGLEIMWQQANHLITTFKALATQPLNFNLIFSNEEDIQSQWDHYYRTLPILLYYSFLVIDEIITSFTSMNPSKPDLLPLKMFAGYQVWMGHSDWNEILFDENNSDLPDNVKFSYNCSKCSKEIILDMNCFEEIFYKDRIKCGHCKFKISLL